jgi:hypothetical protein
MYRRKSFATTLFAGLIAGVLAPGAMAATLNFDDIAPANAPNTDTAVPESYGGLLWKFPDANANGNLEDDFVAGTLSDGVYTDTSSFGYKNTYGSPSGNHALFFNDQFSVSLEPTAGAAAAGTGKFMVTSISASSFAQGNQESADSANILSFIGVNNGQRTQLDFTLSFDKYDTFDLSKLGFMDELIFLPVAGAGVGRGTYFLFDDLTFNVEAAPVPVPAAVWLLGSGIGMLFAGRRKKAA